MPSVLFFTSLDQEIAELITQNAPADSHFAIHPPNLPDEQTIELVTEADFVILFPSRIADDALRAARQLKLIQLVSAGFDQMNIGLCTELGIPVANNGGTNAIDVAEHTVAMILAHYRRFREMDPNVRNDGWCGIDSGRTTYTIEGKTIGIVGLGKIGQRLATLLRPWGAQILFYDPFPPSLDIQQELNAQQMPLNELLQQSDIVTLHVPLSPDTNKLIGAEQLALMQPHALLVNTCRGPVVDETSLIEALRSHQIAGAALDVLEAEPPALDNPLFSLDNVLLTPHTAGVTRDTWPRRGAFIFENLERVWNGETPLAVVNPAYRK